MTRASMYEAEPRENLRAAAERLDAGDPVVLDEIRTARREAEEKITEFERAADRLIADAVAGRQRS